MMRGQGPRSGSITPKRRDHSPWITTVSGRTFGTVRSVRVLLVCATAVIGGAFTLAAASGTPGLEADLATSGARQGLYLNELPVIPTTTAPEIAPATTPSDPATTVADPTTAPTEPATTLADPALTTPTTRAPEVPPPTTQAAADSVADRGAAALARISYPWQQRLPGWTIEFLPGRKGVLGLTFVHEKRIEVYVRDGQSVGFLAHVIAHEMGHAVDVSLNSSADRERWQAARGIESSPWWPGDGATDFSTGAGDFAECFAAWQANTGEFRSRLGATPAAHQLALMAELADG